MTDGKQILVVDDEPVIRMLVKRILGQEGYCIREAGSGEQALAELKENAKQIDLLLTDLKMPGMHGTQLAEEARKFLPDLPVLYMSGYSEELRKLPSADFIQKPFNQSALLNKVRTALDAAERKSAHPGSTPTKVAFTRGLIADQSSDETIRKLIRAEWDLARRKV